MQTCRSRGWVVAMVLAGTVIAGSAAARAQAQASQEHAADEQLLNQVAVQFTLAYNSGDAKAIAALFAPDAEMIDENDDRVIGRENIQALFADLFAARKGATISIQKGLLKFLSPDVALEEGRTTLKLDPASPAADILKYRLLYVKKDGKWLYSSVREEHDVMVSPHQRLQELAWLLGDWIDESADSTVHATCRWSEDQNFLLRHFVVHLQGKPVMKVEERIGWDPMTRQFKSWIFDSEGGHAEALWGRRGDGWIISSKGALHDGRVVLATHMLARQGSHAIRWTSLERTVGGRSVPQSDDYVMVRQAPRPNLKPPGPAVRSSK